MSAVPSAEVTTTQVAAVRFGFYADAEVPPRPGLGASALRLGRCQECPSRGPDGWASTRERA